MLAQVEQCDTRALRGLSGTNIKRKQKRQQDHHAKVGPSKIRRLAVVPKSLDAESR